MGTRSWRNFGWQSCTVATTVASVGPYVLKNNLFADHRLANSREHASPPTMINRTVGSSLTGMVFSRVGTVDKHVMFKVVNRPGRSGPAFIVSVVPETPIHQSHRKKSSVRSSSSSLESKHTRKKIKRQVWSNATFQKHPNMYFQSGVGIERYTTVLKGTPRVQPTCTIQTDFTHPPPTWHPCSTPSTLLPRWRQTPKKILATHGRRVSSCTLVLRPTRD